MIEDSIAIEYLEGLKEDLSNNVIEEDLQSLNKGIAALEKLQIIRDIIHNNLQDAFDEDDPQMRCERYAYIINCILDRIGEE